MQDKRLAKTAKILLRNGEIEQAASLFEKARDYESAIEAYSALKNFIKAGDLAIAIGKGKDAVDYYSLANRFDLVGEYYYSRNDYLLAGQAFTRAGLYLKAAEMYDNLLKKWPDLPDIPGRPIVRCDEEVRIIRLAASVQSRAGNFKKAAKLYRKINVFDEEAKNLVSIKEYEAAGDAYERNGMFADAGQIFSEGKLYLKAAECFAKDQSYGLAAENYNKAGEKIKAGEFWTLAEDPLHAANAYRENDQVDLAIKVLSAIKFADHRFFVACREIIALVKLKRYLTPAAKRFFEELLEHDIVIEEFDCYRKIAQLFQQSDYGEESATLLDRLSAIDPKMIRELHVCDEVDDASAFDRKSFDQILDEDFNAKEREIEYQQRISRLMSAREPKDDSSETLAGKTEMMAVDGGKKTIPPSFMHIQEGQKFGDRYLIIKHLGSGGMGTVYKAKDLELDEFIAIKILSPQLNLDENVVARFKQEIKLARQINHPNVIRIFDLGELYGIRFISMEYFPGEQIKKLISQFGSFSIGKGLKLLLKICEGIIAAHKKGIIHRDIKSQNILFSDEDVVKILDFGIAKSTEIPALTIDGSILGTPEYISPEAILQKPVDVRSDIYSLGIVMFEMFTGAVPFTGDTIMAVIRQHLYDNPPFPRSLNENIPEELEEVILRCIERDPGNRFQSVAELNSELIMLDMAYGENGTSTVETTKLS